MIEEIKVSLIVAIYKSEKFLPKLLDSIINQTYKKIEIILIDDGSPDSSGLICDNYAKKDKRFVVVHQTNKGACAARNNGLKIATGEYITIIEGDDWLAEDYVEHLLSLCVNNSADMSMTTQIFTTRDLTQEKNICLEIWESDKAVSELIYPRIAIGPWNKLYKRTLLVDNSIEFSVPWSGEGLYFATMAAHYSNKVAVSNRKIYYYRLNNLNSGLTNYNVIMGINALENINTISSKLINKSKKESNAINWHIRKNNYFVIFLIVATNSKEKYEKVYNDCLKYIRKNLLDVLIKSNISFKEKVKMILKAFFPTGYAKSDLKKSLNKLNNDKMI